MNSYIYSSDLTLCSVNEDGDFGLTFGDDRAYTLMEKLDKLINGPDIYNFQETDYDTTNPEAFYISDNRSLFAISSIYWLSSLRESEVEYGMHPYPKHDSEQKTGGGSEALNRDCSN